MNKASFVDQMLVAVIDEQLHTILELAHVNEVRLTLYLGELLPYSVDMQEPLRILSEKQYPSQISLFFAERQMGVLTVISSKQLDDMRVIEAASVTLVHFLQNYLSLLQQERTPTTLLRYMLINLQIKDPLTYIHVQQVYSYSLLLAKRIQLDTAGAGALGVSALLHDIGKLSIPNAILKKPTALLQDEVEIIQSHPVHGFEYLLAYPEFINDAYIAFYHHERWDGKGYPYGLVGDTIPLEARILAIADAFDAMTGTRLYRKALCVTEALAEIQRQAGKQFDPYLAHQFATCVRDSLHDRSVRAWNSHE